MKIIISRIVFLMFSLIYKINTYFTYIKIQMDKLLVKLHIYIYYIYKKDLV